MNAFDENPEEAARADRLSRSIDANPEVTKANLDDYEREHRSILIKQLFDNNQHLRDYVMAHPIGAAVSRDDWGQLDTISKAIDPLHWRSSLDPFGVQWAGVDAIGGAFRGFREGFEAAPWGEHRVDISPDASLFVKKIAAGVEGLGEYFPRIFSGIIEAAKGGSKAGLISLGMSPEDAEYHSSQLAGMAESAGFTGRGHVTHPSVEAVQKAFDARVARAAERLRPYLENGEKPPVGVDDLVDEAHKWQAKQDAKNGDELFREAQKSGTRELSPELFGDFLRLKMGDIRIGINAKALRKLYGVELPKPDDNKLGWVDGIQEQYPLALATDGDIQVPLADWLTRATPETKDAVKEGIRWRPDGMTLEESKRPAPAEPTEVAAPKAPVDAMRQDLGIDPPPGRVAEPEVPQPERGIVPEKTAPGEIFGVPSKESFPIREGLAQIDQEGLDATGKALTDFFKERISRLVGNVPIRLLDAEGMRKLAKARRNPSLISARGIYIFPEHEIAMLEDVARGAQGHNEAAHVLIHEGAHALTVRAMREHPEILDLTKSLMDEADKALTRAAPDDRSLHDYAFKNPYEFMAEAYSNPRFRDLLSVVPVSKELAGKLGLKELSTNIWAAIRRVIKDALERLLGQEVPPSILDGVMRLGETFEKIETERGIEQAGFRRLTTGEFGAPPIEDRPLFERAKLIGFSKARYEKWVSLMDKRAEEQAKFERGEAERDERAHQTKQWKENYPAVRDEVKADLRARPDLAADRFLREGGNIGGQHVRKQTLARDSVDPEIAKQLPQEYLGAKGITPDQVATLFGYQDGAGVLNDLVRIEKERQLEGLTPSAHFSRIVEAETEREMKRRFGDPEANVLDRLRDHIYSQTEIDRVAEEMLGMAEKAKAQLPITGDQAKQWVKERFDAKASGLHSSKAYMADVARIERDLTDAFLADDPTEAFKLYQQKYIGMLAVVEAQKLEKALTQIDKLGDRYRKREPTGIPSEHANWLHYLFDRLGLTIGRTLPDLAREIQANPSPAKTFSDFVQSKNQDSKLYGDDVLSSPVGQQMPVAPFLLDPNFKSEISRLTPPQVRAVLDSIKTIVHNGKAESKVMRGTAIDELRVAVNEMVQQLAHAIGKPTIAEFGDRSKSISNVLGVGLLNMETIMNRIDLGNPRGVMAQTIIRPIVEGVNNLAAIEKKYAAELKKVGDFGDLNAKVANPFFKHPQDGSLMDFRRENVLAILQNIGNELQAKKLAGGYGIKDPAQVLRWLFTVTTKEDWDRAQRLGDLFERIFEESAEMYRGLSGVAPERIELQPIETPFGTYRGWYHPLVADPNFTKIGTVKMAELLDGAGYYQPAPAAGYTKGRTGAIYPILLNFDPVPFKIKTMLNDIAMRPAITSVAKIFRDDQFSKAFGSYMGKEYEKSLIPWLRDVAGQRSYNTSFGAIGGKVSDFILQNLISNAIGMNPGTPMKHGPTALVMSMREVGIRSFWREVFHLLGGDPEQGANNWNFAMHGGVVDGKEWTGSQELQRRFRNFVETLTGAEQEVFLRNPWSSRWWTLHRTIQHVGSYPVAISDLLSAVPTWLAAYHDAIATGDLHADAVYMADRAVRRAHGSSAISNRPEIMRGNAAVRYLVPFYNFFNTVLNRQYELAWQSKLFLEGKDQRALRMKGIESIEGDLVTLRPGQYWDTDRLQLEYDRGAKQIPKLMGGLMAWVVIPAIIEQLVSPVYTKQDTWTTTAIKALAYDLSSSWPIVRDAMNYVLGGHDPAVGFYSEALKKFSGIVSDVKKGEAAFEPYHAAKTIRHLNSAASLITGQYEELGKLGEYGYKVYKKQEVPRTFGDIYRGARYGTQRERR